MSGRKKTNLPTHETLVYEFWRKLVNTPRDCRSITDAWDNIQEFEWKASNQRDAPCEIFDINAPLTLQGMWFGYTPLCICLLMFHHDTAWFFLEICKADVNAKSNGQTLGSSAQGRAPLHFAASNASASETMIRVMCRLLQHGADTSAIDTNGMTALHYVCSGRMDRNSFRALNALRDVLTATVDKSSLVSMLDFNGESALSYACAVFQPRPYDIDILNILIENGANVNSKKGILVRAIDGMQDQHRRTMFFGNTRVPRWYKAIKILLLAGADPFAIYEEGSAMGKASQLAKGKHPAADNIKAIFVGIQEATDALKEQDLRPVISHSKMKHIIETVESVHDSDKRRCNQFGRSLSDD
jgi:ankyrin repeat protein